MAKISLVNTRGKVKGVQHAETGLTVRERGASSANRHRDETDGIRQPAWPCHTDKWRPARLPRMDGCDLLDLVTTDETLRQRHAYMFMTADPRRAVDECGEPLEELTMPLLPKPFEKLLMQSK